MLVWSNQVESSSWIVQVTVHACLDQVLWQWRSRRRHCSVHRLQQLQLARGVCSQKDTVGNSVKCPTSGQDSAFLKVMPDHAKPYCLFSLYLATVYRTYSTFIGCRRVRKTIPHVTVFFYSMHASGGFLIPLAASKDQHTRLTQRGFASS